MSQILLAPDLAPSTHEDDPIHNGIDVDEFKFLPNANISIDSVKKTALEFLKSSFSEHVQNDDELDYGNFYSKSTDIDTPDDLLHAIAAEASNEKSTPAFRYFRHQEKNTAKADPFANADEVDSYFNRNIPQQIAQRSHVMLTQLKQQQSATSDVVGGEQRMAPDTQQDAVGSVDHAKAVNTIDTTTNPAAAADDDDDDDDLPPLEVTDLIGSPERENVNANINAIHDDNDDDDDDDGLPSLDEVTTDADSAHKSMLSWFHNIVTTEPLEENPVPPPEGPAGEHNAVPSEIVEATTESSSTPRYTSNVSSITKPEFNANTEANLYDFSHNTLPPGTQISGKARFDRMADKRTSLVLESGAFVKAVTNFPPYIHGRRFYTITMEVWLDELPNTTISLLTNDITRTGTEVVVSREGFIGVGANFGTAASRIHPGIWTTLTISINPEAYSQQALILVNGKIAVSVKDNQPNPMEKAEMVNNTFYIGGGSKQFMLERTMRIRRVLIQPTMMDEYSYEHHFKFSNDASSWQTHYVQHQIQLYKNMSLSSLFNRPPPIWGTTTVLDVVNPPGLGGGDTIPHVGSYLLWAKIIQEAGDTQHHYLPLTYTPALDGHSSKTVEGSIHGVTSSFTSSGIHQSLGRITTAFHDAGLFSKFMPSTDSPENLPVWTRKIVQRLQSLTVGEFTIIGIPIVYKSAPPARVDGEPTVRLIVIHFMIERTSDHDVSITVMNVFPDGGASYHPMSAASESSPLSFQPCINIHHVSYAHIINPLVWTALYTTAATQNAPVYPATFYHTILPAFLGGDRSWDEIVAQCQQRMARLTKATIQLAGEQASTVEEIQSIQTRLQEVYKANADAVFTPYRGEGSSTDLILQTFAYILRRQNGLSELQCKQATLALELRILDMIENDLHFVQGITSSDRVVIHRFLRQVSHKTVSLSRSAAGHQAISSSYAAITTVADPSDSTAVVPVAAAPGLTTPLTTLQLFGVARGMRKIRREISRATKLIVYSRPIQDTLLLEDGGLSKDRSQHSLFPYADPLVRPIETSDLLQADPTRLVPLDLLDFPQTATNYSDLLYVLQKVKDVCVILRNQSLLVKNPSITSRSLLLYIFTEIVPVPVSHYAPSEQREKCMYHQSITRAQQLSLFTVIRLLLHIVFKLYLTEIKREDDSDKDPRQFYPVTEAVDDAITYEPTSHYDSQLISGVLLTILDFILHKQPVDQRSMLVDAVNIHDYGISIGYFPNATAGILMLSPEKAIVRSKVMSYFACTNYTRQLLTLETNYLADYDQFEGILESLIGEQSRSGRMALQNSPVFVAFPELNHIITTMIYIRGILLNPQQWNQQSQRCHAQEESLNFEPFRQVFTFMAGENLLHASDYDGNFYFSIKSAPKHMSMADPHTIVNQHLLKQYKETHNQSSVGYIATYAHTEDQILHIPTLPTFDNTLNQYDSELLLSYLTTPYLRIPLLLSFFASDDRVHAFRSRALCDVFMAALFEQGHLVGPHQAPESITPVQVPSEDPSLIGTSYGLLVNELLHNAPLLVKALQDMLQAAFRLDIGNVHASNSHIILFVIRVACYINNYISWLLDYHDNKLLLYPYGSLGLELTISDDVYHTLTTQKMILDDLLLQQSFHKVSMWCGQLFTELHLKMKQHRYAHHDAKTQLAAAQSKLEADDATSNPDDDDKDDDDDASTKPKRSRRNRKGGGFGFYHFDEPEEEKAQIELPKKPTQRKLIKSIRKNISQMQSSQGTNSFGPRKVLPPVLYQFEDNRIRRRATKRKKAVLPNLDHDDHENGDDQPDKNGNKTSSTVGDKKGTTPAAEPQDEASSDDTTQLFHAACVMHIHLLLLRRNLTDISSTIATEIISSIMYVTTHYNWSSKQAGVINDQDLYGCLHRLRRRLITVVDTFKQQELNESMDHVVRVATGVSPVNLDILLEYMASQQLPLDHPIIQSAIELQKEQATRQQRLLQRSSYGGLGGPHSSSSSVQLSAVNPDGTTVALAPQSLQPTTSAISLHDHVDDNKMHTIRQWGYVPGPFSRGKYVSPMEPHILTESQIYHNYISDVEDIYAKELDCEIDLQNMQISIRNAQMEPIPASIANGTIYQLVFDKPLQAALVDSNPKKAVYRIVGTGVNVTTFTTSEAVTPRVENSLSRLYDSSELPPSEQWLISILEPFRLKHLSNPWDPVLLALPEEITPPDADSMTVFVVAKRTMKITRQLVIYRARKVIHMYEFISYNDITYPAINYTSDVRFSLMELQQDASDRPHMWQHWDRYECDLSCLASSFYESITRTTSEPDNLAGTTELLIPPTVLQGVLPATLLERYTFWQDTDDNLRGYPKSKSDGYIIFIELLTLSSIDTHKLRGTTARITRVPLHIMKQRLQDKLAAELRLNAQADDTDGDVDAAGTDDNVDEKSNAAVASTDGGDTSLTTTTPAQNAADMEYNRIYELVDLLHAPRYSALYQLASNLTRLESLATILAWKVYDPTVSPPTNGSEIATTHINPQDTLQQAKYQSGSVHSSQDSSVTFAPQEDGDDDENVDPHQLQDDVLHLEYIELTRAKLTFRTKQDPLTGESHLYSLDHNELFLSNDRSEQLTKLTAGIPHSLLMQDRNHNYFILVPALSVYRPSVKSAPFHTEMLLGLDRNFTKSQETSYFLYPIHVSQSFLLTPTLASSLYLLVLLFNARMYNQASQLLDGIVCDTPLQAGESAITSLFATIRMDLSPEGISLMLRITHALLNATKTFPWSVSQLIVMYSAYAHSSQATTLLRVPLHEELELLRMITPEHIEVAIKHVQSKSPDFGLDLYAAYNRCQYLESLIYEMPSRKVLVPDHHRTEVSYNTTVLPSVEHFIRWYLDNREKIESSSVPSYTVHIPEPSGSNSNQKEVAFEFTKDNDVFPSYLTSVLPKKSQYKADVTTIQQPYMYLATLTNSTAPQVLRTKQSLFPKSGYGFLLAYTLLTSDTLCRLHNVDCSYAMGAFLTRVMRDCTHRHPCNFILRLLVEKPELAAVFPKLSQFKSISYLRSTHKVTTGFNIGAFILMIGRTIAKLYTINPLWVTLNGNTSPTRPRHRQSPPAHTIPMLKQQHERANIIPTLSDTDCKQRYSIPLNLADADVKQALELLDGHLVDDVHRDTLCHTPLATLGLAELIQHVSRDEAGLALISEQLPFNLADHSSAQPGIAKQMLVRLQSDVEVYAQATNKKPEVSLTNITAESLTSYFGSSRGQNGGNGSQNGSHAIDQTLTSIVDIITKVRNTDRAAVTRLQSALHQLVNNVPLVTHLQHPLVKVLYHSDASLFEVSPEIVQTHTKFNAPTTGGARAAIGAKLNEEELLHERLLFILARDSGHEVEIWNEYVYGALISSQAVYDILKLNPFLPPKFIGVVFSLAELSLLLSNRIAQMNRALNDVYEIQTLLAVHSPEGNIPLSDSNTAKNGRTAAGAGGVSQTVVTNILQKSEALIRTLQSKRHYYDIVDRTAVQNDANRVKHDEKMYAAWHRITSTQKQPKMVPTHIAEAISQRLSQEIDQRIAQALGGKNIPRHTIVLDASTHPLIAFCSIRDRQNFLLRYAESLTRQSIGENLLRKEAGQPLVEPSLWGIIQQVPLPRHQLDEHVKQGRYGLSTIGRAGTSYHELQHALSLLANENTTTPIYTYDPRFLVFEFTWSLLLRQSQVTMVREFSEAIQTGNSLVKQMIMGAGKTTVVAPLLALMLTDGKSLLMEVVPPALLEFSRSVMRSTFSSIIYKRVLTLQFERASEATYDTLRKLNSAIAQRGVVLTTPTAIKSVMLKFLELQYQISHPEYGRDDNSVEQLSILAKILDIFRDGILLMDEVDMILHPLKSELNFPFGPKQELDFSPLRWQLSMHILDAMFYFIDRKVPDEFADSRRAQPILEKLNTVVQTGFQQQHLQQSPHLILLNDEYYHTDIKPLMIDWVILWADAHFIRGISHDEIRQYISIRNNKLLHSKYADLVTAVNALPSHHIQALNLMRDWIRSYLPHVLKKIDRVSFGLLSLHDLTNVLRNDPYMPQTRAKLAIPFVGKDVPSHASEFAHPDIIIGLTYLAYRYEGLRYPDFVEVVDALRTSVQKEMGKYEKRPSNLRFNEWVRDAGGFILGSGPAIKGDANADAAAASTHPLAELLGLDKSAMVDGEHTDIILPTSDLALHTSDAGVVTTTTDDGEAEGYDSKKEIVSLRLLKKTNYQQMDYLFQLWSHHSPVIQFYLTEFVFPRFMRHQHVKFSASGVDLGSDMLFSRRIGFSGTPSDLLPLDLGQCGYERGSDGQVIVTLTNPSVVSYTLLDKDWTVEDLLTMVATARAENNPQELTFHALIDTGALITGMSNQEVAEYLLDHGLGDTVDGVVFLDDLDRKMVLVRVTRQVVQLSQCGIPDHRRFAFYDQVHTTGMDISHRLDACAAVTLGKDMVFRDYAQGAYRMRNIGQGQTIRLLVAPEIDSLITRELAQCGDDVIAPIIQQCHGGNDTATALSSHTYLVRVAAWLVVSSMLSERTQHCQLCIQNLTNVWKKSAFKSLLQHHSYFNFDRFPNSTEVIDKEQARKEQQDTIARNQFLEKLVTTESDRARHKALLAKYDKIMALRKAQEAKKERNIARWEQFQRSMSVYSVLMHSQMLNLTHDRPIDSQVKEVLNDLRAFLKKGSVSSYDIGFSFQPTGDDALKTITEKPIEKAIASKTDGFGFDTAGNDDTTTGNIADVNKSTVGVNDQLKIEFVPADDKDKDAELGKHVTQCMEIFYETVNLSVDTEVPQCITFIKSIEDRIEQHTHLLASTNQHDTCQYILTIVKSTAHDVEEYTLDNEMVQTLEDEREKEIEQEQEQEIEIEKFVDAAYSRDNEEQISWPFDSLGQSPDANPQFYLASQFKVHLKTSIVFPDEMMISDNYYNNTWVGARRIKNLIMYLDWVPSLAKTVAVTIASELGAITDVNDPTNNTTMTITPTTNDEQRKQSQWLSLTETFLNQYMLSVRLIAGDKNINHLSLEQVYQFICLLTGNIYLTSADRLRWVQDHAPTEAAEGRADDGVVSQSSNTLSSTSSEPHEQSYQLYVELAAFFTLYDITTLTADQLKQLCQISAFNQSYQTERKTVAVSLAEAQTIRRIVHVRSIVHEVNGKTKQTSIIPASDAAFALRCSSQNNTILASTSNFIPSTAQQTHQIWQLYRFFSNESHFTHRDITALLHHLDRNSPAERVAWYASVIGCRRRMRLRWDDNPVAHLLTCTTRLHRMKTNALSYAVTTIAKMHGVDETTLFSWFDMNRDGKISPSELYGGIRWLHVSSSITAQDIVDWMHSIHLPHGASLSFKELSILLKADNAGIEDDDNDEKIGHDINSNDLVSPSSPTDGKNALPALDTTLLAPYGEDELEVLLEQRKLYHLSTQDAYNTASVPATTPVEDEDDNAATTVEAKTLQQVYQDQLSYYTSSNPHVRIVSTSVTAKVTDDMTEEEKQNIIEAQEIYANTPLCFDISDVNAVIAIMNFSTPTLPPNVELIGDGQYIDAGTGCQQDNYWEIGPYSGLIVNPPFELLDQDVPMVSNTAFSVETKLQIPQSEMDYSTNTPVNPSMIYHTAVENAKQQLLKAIYCSHAGIATTQWVSNDVISAKVTDNMMNEILTQYTIMMENHHDRIKPTQLHQKSSTVSVEQHETSSSDVPQHYDPQILRAVKYYTHAKQRLDEHLQLLKDNYSLAGEAYAKSNLCKSHDLSTVKKRALWTGLATRNTTIFGDDAFTIAVNSKGISGTNMYYSCAVNSDWTVYSLIQLHQKSVSQPVKTTFYGGNQSLVPNIYNSTALYYFNRKQWCLFACNNRDISPTPAYVRKVMMYTDGKSFNPSIVATCRSAMSWKCEQCSAVSQNLDETACAICQAERVLPVADDENNDDENQRDAEMMAAGFSFGGFGNFGGAPHDGDAGGFSFGDYPGEGNPDGGFAFGSSDENANLGGFAFGGADDDGNAGGFSFGAPHGEGNPNGFGFGGSDENTDLGGFAFGNYHEEGNDDDGAHNTE